MPSYSKIIKISGRQAEDLYEIIAREIDAFFKKIGLNDFTIEHFPDQKRLSFKSSMAKLEMSCEFELIRLEGSLSLLAMPFRSKLDQSIDRWIQKTFGA